MLRKIAASALLLAVANAGPVHAQSASSASPVAVEITNAWARATPGRAENGAAYLTVTSVTGDRLLGISSPVARAAEIHEMRMDGTVMQMRPVPALDLPAGQAVTLKPGGYHVMLLGLQHPLAEGETVALTLSFEKAGNREVSVPVQRAGATGSGGTASQPPHAH